jgi:hypothetical protein
VAHPVNAIQDVQQVQLLPHADAEVMEPLARHQHHADAAHQLADAEAQLADAEAQQAVVEAQQADRDQQTVVADLQLAMLKRLSWFLNKSMR